MPIGSSLNATPPERGDSPSLAASRIIDTFNRLVAAVEGPVPSAALDVTGDIDLQLHGLENVGQIALGNMADNDEGLPGWVFRYNNNLWFVHPDGAFQITDGVGLNAAGIGGIGGDYGAGSESVEYVLADQEYIFLDAPGDYSDIAVRGVRFVGDTTGYVRVRADVTVDSNVEWLLKEPSATTSQLVVQTSAGVTGTATSSADAFTFNGALTVGGTLVRVARSMTQFPVTQVDAAGFWTQQGTTASTGVVAPSGAGTETLRLWFPLHAGDTVKSMVVHTKGGDGTETFRMAALYANAGTTTSLGSSTNAIPALSTAHTIDFTDHTMATYDAFFVEINRVSGSGTTVQVNSVTLIYDGA